MSMMGEKRSLGDDFPGALTAKIKNFFQNEVNKPVVIGSFFRKILSNFLVMLAQSSQL